jgi:uncharacterized membrane protein
MAMGSGSEGRGSIFRFDTRQIVVAGIIGGIALFLGFTRLGFIPVPIPLIGNATIMHIPAIVGGALEGPIVGLLAGAIFGIFSFLQADNPVFLNPVVAIVPRLLIGVVAWAVFVGLRRWSVDLAAAAAGLLGSFANTVGVVGLAILFGLLPVAIIPRPCWPRSSRSSSSGVLCSSAVARRPLRRTSRTKNAAINQGAAR